MTSVLIVDDSFVMRTGLRSFIGSFEGFEVVGEAASGNEAVRAARELRPAIVLMDLRMPDGDGVTATRTISHDLPESRTVVLTWSEEPGPIGDVLLAGAKAVLVHGHYASDELGEILLEVRAARPARPILRVPLRGDPDQWSGDPLDPLTGREREILERVRRGLPNRAIAEELGIAEKTVKNHLNSIYSKLDLHSRLEAMAGSRSEPDPS